MTHKCDDQCPSAAKRGPKLKCCKCGNLCYLNCFDFEAGEKIDGQQTVKLSLNGRLVFSTFVSTMAFSCCSNTMTPSEQTNKKNGLKLPSVQRSTSTTRAATKSNEEQLLANKLNSIEEMLISIKNATESNTAEIAAIKSLSTKTDATVKKVSEQNATMQQLSTPKGPAMQYVTNYRARSYAAAAAQTAAGTPSGKRKREQTNEPQKPNFPEPKVGTNSNGNGLKVVPKVIRAEKPTFTKAMYVGGLGPDTENAEIAEYITQFTPVQDANKFKVHKMVKKGVDLGTLKSVSFKVELNEHELEMLNKPELWPQGVLVREFTLVPKNQLGNYLFPDMQAKKPAISATTNAIDANTAATNVIDGMSEKMDEDAVINITTSP